MNTAVILDPPALLVEPEPPIAAPLVPGRVASFIALTKPRIALMVLVTVAVGYVMGARGEVSALSLLLTVLGTGLVAAGASVWNQVIERDRDGRMRRTANRPIPAGRVARVEAGLFGSVLGLLGVAILATGLNGLSAVVAATTFFLYVAVYTPLKAFTTLNTVVGAIPGALPPVIGWAAATGRLGIEPGILFLIVFLWQFPHFLAIAWIYREDYARGGLKMLPGVDPDGSMTGRQAMWYAALLLPVGLMPCLAMVGLGGRFYFVGALALGLFYFSFSVKFWLDVNDRTARGLLRASVLYLPLILLLLLLNPAQ